MDISRRMFLGGTMMAAAGCYCTRIARRHRSDYDGVQIGAISYSFRSMPKKPFATLRNALGAGLGTIELMGTDLECDAFMPFAEKPRKELSASEAAAQVAWRKKADVGIFDEVKRRYDDCDVNVHIVKFGQINNPKLEDWELDYCFKAAQAMGAGVITCELPPPADNFAAFKDAAVRLREYVGKYGVKVAFHNHLQLNAKTYDGPLLGWCDGFMINFDIGHYVAANDDSPLDFIEKYHDRICSIHLKDRTTKANGQKNLPFGQGDTPLEDLFDLLQWEDWDYPCDIELEYKIPDESDAVREVHVANRFCRELIFA